LSIFRSNSPWCVMKYYRKNTIYFRRGNGRRGSVIVLVVAVLALLAVIGTVYIVSARTERGSAVAGSMAENLDLAQQAVNEQALRLVGESIYDANGRLGGQSAGLGPFGRLAARRHDIAEANPLAGVGVFDPSARDQSWLATDIFRPTPADPTNVYTLDMTFPAGRTQVKDAAGPILAPPGVFDPSAPGDYGDFAIPVFTFNNGNPSLNAAVFNPNGGRGFFRVVTDTHYLQDGSRPPIVEDAFVQLLPFSEASGTRYRFGIRIIDTSRMANLNVGMPYNMGGPSQGTYTPAMAGPTVFENAGTFYNSYSISAPSIFNPAATFTLADQPGSLWGTPSAGNPGRLGAWATNATQTSYLDYYWGRAAFGFENPSAAGGTTYSHLVAPFDLIDELELRALGNKGTMAVARPALGYNGGTPVWPNTLGNRNPNSNNVQAGFWRNFYTTYSYSRELRRYADPIDGTTNTLLAYEVLPSNGTWALPITGTRVWPAYPGCVSVNPDISWYTPVSLSGQEQLSADTLAIAATNIATAMQMCIPSGYSAAEARAFVANYLTCRWNSWVQLPDGSFRLVDGPSFVDENGFCIRGGTAMPNNGEYSSPGSNGLNSGSANKVYLGYAAQPFINEVAVSYHFSAGTGQWTEEDCAVELYNPYDVPLSLEDFKLNVKSVDVDFSGKNLLIPARGYFVVTNVTGKLDANPTAIPAAQRADATTLGNAIAIEGAESVYLMRKYRTRGAANLNAWAAVDQYKVNSIAAKPAITPSADTDEIDFVARPNVADPDISLPNLPRWLATAHDPVVAAAKHVHGTAAPDLITLGASNASDGIKTAIIPLYDRTIDLCASTGAYDARYTRLVLANIGDFNRIARITNEIDPLDATVAGASAGNGTISSQLFQKIDTPDAAVNDTTFKADAGVHFDFRTSPKNFVPGAPPPPSDYKDGDLRAARLLQCLTFTDRLSDFTIDLGDNYTSKTVSTPFGALNVPDRGASKLRIPGQINVNTASAEVLASIPVLQQNPTLIGHILAYRWRITTNDPRIPAGCRPATMVDFSNQLEFPGYGIHTLSELQIPIMVAQVNASIPLLTIDQRDQLWARLYNCLTVRSDTFVVYAYLEAVRQNPRYTGAFNNSSDWYVTADVPGGITDSPNDSTRALLRTAKRRWVAIVDRSQANYSRYIPSEYLPPNTALLDPRFTGARIVAQKDMPR
jgi:hypothetical protein